MSSQEQQRSFTIKPYEIARPACSVWGWKWQSRANLKLGSVVLPPLTPPPPFDMIFWRCTETLHQESNSVACVCCLLSPSAVRAAIISTLKETVLKLQLSPHSWFSATTFLQCTNIKRFISTPTLIRTRYLGVKEAATSPLAHERFAGKTFCSVVRRYTVHTKAKDNN